MIINVTLYAAADPDYLQERAVDRGGWRCNDKGGRGGVDLR